MNTTQRLTILALVLSLLSFSLGIAAWWKVRKLAPADQGAALTPESTWLAGNTSARFDQVGRQLRGLDVTMIEIDHRFTELFYAGKDGNWDYAKYQAQKIDHALRLALERRPKRVTSAQPFLDHDLRAVLATIESRKLEQFDRSMGRLRVACVKCHTEENVPYFTVELPQQRASTIRPKP